MPQFRYVARKSDGKLIDGVLTCNDRSAAILEVEKQGGVPIKIEPVRRGDGLDDQERDAARARKNVPRRRAASSGKATPTGAVTTLAHDPAVPFHRTTRASPRARA